MWPLISEHYEIRTTIVGIAYYTERNRKDNQIRAETFVVDQWRACRSWFGRQSEESVARGLPRPGLRAGVRSGWQRNGRRFPLSETGGQRRESGQQLRLQHGLSLLHTNSSLWTYGTDIWILRTLPLISNAIPAVKNTVLFGAVRCVDLTADQPVNCCASSLATAWVWAPITAAAAWRPIDREWAQRRRAVATALEQAGRDGQTMPLLPLLWRASRGLPSLLSCQTSSSERSACSIRWINTRIDLARDLVNTLCIAQ